MKFTTEDEREWEFKGQVWWPRDGEYVLTAIGIVQATPDNYWPDFSPIVHPVRVEPGSQSPASS